MTVNQNLSGKTSSDKNKPKLLALLLPLLSCSITSVIGIIIGQVGNLIYRVLGNTAICLTIPGFIGLFALTVAISFLTNRLLRRLFNSTTKKGAH